MKSIGKPIKTIGKQQAQPSPAQSSAAQPSRERLDAQSFENQWKSMKNHRNQ